jgi:hypothetical protein
VTRRSILWRAGALLFILINVGGAVMAAVDGEAVHTFVHVALLAGTYVLWQLIPGGGRKEPLHVPSPEDPLDQLQQSIDAVALEVERIGEAQRFMTKLQQEGETQR